MQARVIHVGEDYWHRLPVMRRAGMPVEECRGVQDLTAVLRTGTDPAAVLLAASPTLDPKPATEIIRLVTKAPVILFSEGSSEPEPQRYDLIIDPLTAPAEWLTVIWATIGRSQQLRADCQGMMEYAEKLMRDSAEAVRRSQEQRERARRLMQALGAAEPGPRRG